MARAAGDGGGLTYSQVKKVMAERFGAAAFADCPGPPGRLSALSVFLCKSFFYGAFVWARRALKHQQRRFPARAGKEAVQLRLRQVPTPRVSNRFGVTK